MTVARKEFMDEGREEREKRKEKSKFALRLDMHTSLSHPVSVMVHSLL